MKKVRTYIIAIIIPLLVGGVAGRISREGFAMYSAILKPPLSPPEWVFPLVWAILYILMGAGSAIVWLSDSEGKKDALFVYAIQLFINFFWPVFFFNYGAFWVAFFWLALLAAFAADMVVRFWKISPTAGLINLPYLAWLAYALYLNLGVCLLN